MPEPTAPRRAAGRPTKLTPVEADGVGLVAADFTPKKRGGQWREAFLSNLRQTANVRLAAAAANISRDNAYQARGRSQEFRQQWDSAMQDACDILEGHARARAIASSDTLLIFLLKAHRPEVYRERIDIRVRLIDQARERARELGMSEDDAVAAAEAVLKGAR